MGLTRKQRSQIKKQLAQHRHKAFDADVQIEGLLLKGFRIHQNVFRPDIMSSSQILARFLLRNRKIYLGKHVLDMGCGSGLQGIVVGLKGATSVTLSDISFRAVRNTRENIRRFGLQQKSTIVKSDLFDGVDSKFDVIVFNHPFFGDKPLRGAVISRSMLDAGELIRRFLQQAKDHLNAGGIIVMPFFHFAGRINDPSEHAEEYGYTIQELVSITSSAGLQKGKFSIYALKVKQL